MQLLGAGVRGLSRPEQLLPVLGDLGRRHTGYGVRPEDYDTVGAALLWTLERGLGDAFGPDLRAAWTAAYAPMAVAMQEGAAGEPLAAGRLPDFLPPPAAVSSDRARRPARAARARPQGRPARARRARGPG